MQKNIFSKFQLVLVMTVMTVSFAVMVGWFIHSSSIVQLQPSFTPMQFNTALMFFFLSLSMFCALYGWALFARWFASIVSAGSGIAIVQYALGQDWDLGTIFVKPFTVVGSPVPGRMALSTAVCLFLLSFVAVFKKRKFISHFISACSASIVLGFSILGLLGYFINIHPGYGWGTFSGMALHTSSCFIFLAVAMLVQMRKQVLRELSYKLGMIPMIISFSGILLSIGIWQLLVEKNLAENRHITQIHATAMVTNINNNIVPLTQAVERMAVRFGEDVYRKREIWQVDAESFFRHFTGLKILAWADSNSIVQWQYPPAIDEKKLHINLLKYPTVAEQVQETILSRQPYFSRNFNFITGGKGFFLRAPIFQKQHYRGLICAGILSDSFFQNSVNMDGYNLIFSEGDQVIFRTGQIDPVLAKDWTYNLNYAIYNIQWQIKVIPTLETIRANTSFLPFIVLLFGCTISMCLGLSVYFFFNSYQLEISSRRQAEWYEASINSLPILVVSTDETGLIKACNKAVETLLEYSADELIGKHSPEIWHDHREIFQQAEYLSQLLHRKIEANFEVFSAITEAGLSNASEWTLISKSGKRYVATLSVSRIYNEQGQITGYMGLIEDITQKREREKQLTEQEAKIIASSRMASLGEMAAGIAHEINNPLAIINGHVGLLRRILHQKYDEVGEDLFKKLDAIEMTVQRMAKIIRGLRSYARESDPGDEELASVSALIDETISFCAEKFKSEGVGLIVQVEPDLKFKGRPYQISQVLLNLLNNALDAVRDLNVKQVEVQARSRDSGVESGVEISVTDSGHGVRPDLRDKIMQPFFTTKEVGQGVGLGLSISQGIIHAHKGQFYLDEKSERTCFVMWLPS